MSDKKRPAVTTWTPHAATPDAHAAPAAAPPPGPSAPRDARPPRDKRTQQAHQPAAGPAHTAAAPTAPSTVDVGHNAPRGQRAPRTQRPDSHSSDKGDESATSTHAPGGHVHPRALTVNVTAPKSAPSAEILFSPHPLERAATSSSDTGKVGGVCCPLLMTARASSCCVFAVDLRLLSRLCMRSLLCGTSTSS